MTKQVVAFGNFTNATANKK